MQMFNWAKKGAGGVSKAMGVVFLILVLVALTGVIFSNTTGLGNTSIFGGAPTWVYTIFVVATAVGLVKLIVPSK